MDKYVPIAAVTNFVPLAVRESLSSLDLQSLANTGYRLLRITTHRDHDVVDREIINHSVVLPDGLTKINDILFTDVLISSDSQISDQIREIGTDKFMLYQRILFDYKESGGVVQPLYYRGQNRSNLIHKELYCYNCRMGFTVDKTMKCLTIDAASGSVIIVYERGVVSDAGEVMIPDDAILLQALGYFVEAMFWRDRSGRHEQNAFTMYNEAYNQYLQLSGHYKGIVKMKSLGVGRMRTALFSGVRYDFDNRNYIE